ncbi:hypothetical protein I3F58_00095 [Streptomyces sp. MUM 203J]|uniref:DUF6234 family protein n=1 Tax=Streptomyces sp. MUM 203J TaxID=2791990 RepID=UPI001F03A1DD|nr:DUF6234 family protein [Streptomyces sp. MUM 203J]MCH0537985.1 hypothetical protein [Streptomyces sp. MUM 203J]
MVDTGRDSAADIALAIGMFVAEAAALALAWYCVGISAWADGKNGTTPEGLSYDGMLMVAAGVVAAVALVVAVRSARGRLWVTVWSQGLVGCLLAVGVLGFAEYTERQAPPPPPEPYVRDMPPCRSGTDCSESGG